MKKNIDIEVSKSIKMANVNLDALIPRDDFDFDLIKEKGLVVPTSQTVTISELEQGKPFLAILRKPDFQRETNEWTPERVSDLIKSLFKFYSIKVLWRTV
jgi:hypothetical protein